MDHNNIVHLFREWNSQAEALTSEFEHQVKVGRMKRGLNVGVQNRLSKNGVNKKVLLGSRYEPRFIKPRGKSWLRVAELAGL